jgi:hypothetical protein
MSSQVGEGDDLPSADPPGGADHSTALGGTVGSISGRALPARPTQAGEPATAELTARLARAESERDTAIAALDKLGRRDRRWKRTRQAIVGVLVVLFSILLPLTFVVSWVHNVALNTKGFERTVVPIGSDRAVTAAAGAAITNQIFASLNPQQIVANSLPANASFLAGPITIGVRGYVQDGVTRTLQSSQFQALWKQATLFAHTQLLSVLNGNNKAVTTTNGQVVLNLVPLFNAALENLQGFISAVVGRQVKLPTISGNELPAVACQNIATALGRPVPATCGQIALFPASRLTQARRAVRIFNRAAVLLLIVTPVVGALAVWLSRRRRRTLLQLCAGGVFGLVVVRRAVIWLHSSLLNTGQPANKAARQAILTHLLHAYFSISRWLLIGLIAVLLIALVTGPYGWAGSLRRIVTTYAREGWNLIVATTGRANGDSTIAWVGSHLDLLRILGVAIAAFLLIALPVSWIGFLVIAVLLVAYELWLHRLGQTASPADSATPPKPSPDGPADRHPVARSETGQARVQ